MKTGTIIDWYNWIAPSNVRWGRTRFKRLRRPEAFLYDESMCSQIDNVWSSFTSRYLYVDVVGSSLYLCRIFRLWCFIFCEVPNNIASVLPFFILQTRSIDSSQETTALKSSQRHSSIRSIDFPGTYRTVSSAYVIIWEWVRTDSISLNVSKNSNGPRMDPWGTPHVTLQLATQTALLASGWTDSL